MKLTLSIIFLTLAVLSWIAITFFFAYGLILGPLFLSLSIWFFAEWKYKKIIPLSISGWLFILPVLGFYTLLTANKDFSLLGLFFPNNLPPTQIPLWVMFLSLLGRLFWYAVPILFIIYFFHKAKKY